MKKTVLFATLVVFLSLTSGDEKLIGRPDGHDSPGGKLIGRPDGHDFSSDPLIGRPDGHDFSSDILIGRPDGHDFSSDPLIGGPDGHDFPSGPGRDEGTRKPLIGGKDGHENFEYEFSKTEDGDIDDIYDDDDNAGEKPLVRCKHPICDEVLSCPFGSKTDSRGCRICECLEDPCKNVECETGFTCDFVDCPVGLPCKKLSSKCVLKHCSGPEPMCANYCPLGYKHNEDGCMTCTCRQSPTVPLSTPATDVNEEDINYYEDTLNEDGDHDDRHHDDVEGSKETGEDEDDNEDDDEDDEELNEFMDKGEMCEGLRCRLNEVCEAEWKYPGDIEGEKTNHICMVKTRCWAVANQLGLYAGRNLDSRLACDSDWTFEPLQCRESSGSKSEEEPKTCWCVNDLGDMIDGTRTPIYAEEQKPICERNTTISASLSLVFEITKPGSSSKTIVEILLKELSKITFAPRNSIKILSVEYPQLPLNSGVMNKVMVNFALSSNPNYDLPLGLDLLFNVKNLTLNFDLYEVRQLSQAQVVSYQFALPAAPTPMVDVEVEEEDLPRPDPELPVQDFINDYRPAMRAPLFNKSVIVACLVVLVGLIVAILTIIVILARRNCNRRGHIRHHPLLNQISIPIDPDQFMGNSMKNDSVALVNDDVLNQVKEASVA